MLLVCAWRIFTLISIQLYDIFGKSSRVMEIHVNIIGKNDGIVTVTSNGFNFIELCILYRKQHTEKRDKCIEIARLVMFNNEIEWLYTHITSHDRKM